MRIAYIINTKDDSGVGHRAVNIAGRLKAQSGVELDVFDMDGKEMTVKKNGGQVAVFTRWPGVLGKKTVGWVRLGQTIKNEIKKESYDIIHLTNQTLSFLVDGSIPSVVTVHDVIELLDPQTKSAYLINKYLYNGIKRASHIIAVSEYTAQTLKDFYELPAERITVVLNGVGGEFHLIDNFMQTVAAHSLKQELKLQDEAKVILYIGSDHPRKNVVGAIRTFSKIQEQIPELVFVKVGEPGIAAGREQLLKEIDDLKLRVAVRFVGNVSDERLNELYNLADVLIYPSRFEGFGLPPLQAFAAGTPVVCSNATSLPEVVGDAALKHNPDDIDGMAVSTQKILEDSNFASSLQLKGLERAKQFSWDVAADKVKSVYRELI
ncbi:MAG: glycosyltransferase family 1 protein [bacterium]